MFNIQFYNNPRRANSVQNRMNLMRAKFQTLQVDDDNEPDGDINTPALNNSAVNRSISEKSHLSSQSMKLSMLNS